ncbi:MAG: hypothetical protein IPN72_17400 [Saprospiraceae bacterium]|nr:hypothetical protein [Saprospiraceae bacterium]
MGGAGLNGADMQPFWNSGKATATTGETVFAGPTDDPFSLTLGGILILEMLLDKKESHKVDWLVIM